MRAQIKRQTLLVIATLALALCAASTLAQTVLEVIPLKYRTAEDVIPVLTPMLAREGSLSGLRGQLIVRTTPQNLGEILRVLTAIDTPLRRLLITVAQDVSREGTRYGGEVALRTDDSLRLTLPRGSQSPRPGVEVYALDARNTDSLRVVQTVQVTDGNTAYVQAGRSTPVQQQTVTRSVVGGRVVEQVTDSVNYRSASTGFYVVPRVAGDRVTLDVSSQREALMRHVPGMVDGQLVVTTVAGRLGEWIDVAVTGEQRGNERDGLLGRAGSARTENRSVVLKVEEIR
jgi:type II secretory pathway component GspD/PulD (secretin)